MTVILETVGPTEGTTVEFVGEEEGPKVVGLVVGYHVGGSVAGVGEMLGLRVLTVGLFVGLHVAPIRVTDNVGPIVGLPLTRVGCIVGGE